MMVGAFASMVNAAIACDALCASLIHEVDIAPDGSDAGEQTAAHEHDMSSAWTGDHPNQQAQCLAVTAITVSSNRMLGEASAPRAEAWSPRRCEPFASVAWAPPKRPPRF